MKPSLLMFTAILLIIVPVGKTSAQSSMSSIWYKANTSKLQPGDSMNLMMVRAILKSRETKELDLTDDQWRAISSLDQEMAEWERQELERLCEPHGGIAKVGSNFELSKQIEAQINEATEKKWIGKVEEDVLVPFQVEKLKAVCVAYVRGKLGDKEFFALPWVREQLEIDDEQLKRINDRIDVETEKLEAETKRLMALLEKAKDDATRGILSELGPSQREKAFDLFPGFELDKSKR